MTNEIIFFTQVASIMGFILALFILYRVLVSQKDAVIESLKEKNSLLEFKNSELSENTPDALAKTLHDRVEILSSEIERLSLDKEHNQAEITQKESELMIIKEEVQKLSQQIDNARELMEEFFCPHCGAPMETRECHSETIEWNGHDADIDHERVTYECGYTIEDNKESNPCKKQRT